jgi:hypothetical protein
VRADPPAALVGALVGAGRVARERSCRESRFSPQLLMLLPAETTKHVLLLSAEPPKARRRAMPASLLLAVFAGGLLLGWVLFGPSYPVVGSDHADLLGENALALGAPNAECCWGTVRRSATLPTFARTFARSR